MLSKIYHWFKRRRKEWRYAKMYDALWLTRVKIVWRNRKK
jgi:hypothetical protein